MCCTCASRKEEGKYTSLHLADHVLEFVVDVVKCDRINVEVLSLSFLYAEGIIQLSFLVFKEYG